MPGRFDLPLQGVACLLLLAGCSGGEPECIARAVTPLVAAGGWRIAPPEEDPFPDRPSAVSCVPQSVLAEGDAVEVNTEECDYVTLVQPTSAELSACEHVAATVAHYPLVAEAPATAHAALMLGDDVIWERRIAIPGDAAVYEVSHPVRTQIPRGTDLYFHLHNHGANDWYLSDVQRK